MAGAGGAGYLEGASNTALSSGTRDIALSAKCRETRALKWPRSTLPLSPKKAVAEEEEVDPQRKERCDGQIERLALCRERRPIVPGCPPCPQDIEGNGNEGEEQD